MERERKINILLDLAGVQKKEYGFIELIDTVISKNNSLLDFRFQILEPELFDAEKFISLAKQIKKLNLNVSQMIFTIKNCEVLETDVRSKIALETYNLNNLENCFLFSLNENGLPTLIFENKEKMNLFKRKNKFLFDFCFSKYLFNPNDVVYILTNSTKVKEKAKDFLTKEDFKIYENDSQLVKQKPLNLKQGYVYGGLLELSDIPKTKETAEEKGRMVIDVIGEVFAIEVKEVKEKVRYTFYITDYNDSIMVSAYVTDKWSTNLATIEVGDSISVKGEIKFDTFANEVIVSSVVDGIAQSELVFKKKCDFDETFERTELHVHSNFTAQDGLTTVDEYFANAKKYGINALAITDLENVQAYPSIATASKKHGIKPIYGVELNVVDEDEFKIVYERSKHDNSFVALDIETTGFSSNYDEITEISAFKVVDGEQKEYSVLCKLSDYSKLTSSIQELTSITPELLQEEGIEIDEALKGLIDFIGESYIVAHNAKFDIPFIEAKIKQILKINKTFSYIDTLNLSKVVLKDEMKKFGLNVVCKKLGVELTQHHRAIYDTIACYNVFIKLLEKLEYIYKDEYELKDFPIKAKIPYNNRKTQETILKAISKHLIDIEHEEQVDIYCPESGSFSVSGNKEYIESHINEYGLKYVQISDTEYEIYYCDTEEKKNLKKINSKKGHAANISVFEQKTLNEKNSKASGVYSLHIVEPEGFQELVDLKLSKCSFYIEKNLYRKKLSLLNNLITKEMKWNSIPYHVTVLVKNQTGLKNLYKIISIGHTKYIGRDIITPKRVLDRYREGLLYGTSCYNGLFRTVFEKDFDEFESRIDFYDYVELQPLSCYASYKKEEDEDIEFELIESMRKVIDWCVNHDKIVVASSDAHYLTPDMKQYRDIYINTPMVGGKMHPLSKRVVSDHELRTTSSLIEEFDRIYPRYSKRIVIDGPNSINEMIDDNIRIVQDHLCVPTDDFLKGRILDIVGHEVESIEEEFKRIVYSNLKRYEVDGVVPELVQKRVEKEMNAILTNGFTVNYYIAYLLVKQSNKDGYIVGSRGSVGSSFVAYLMGITEVNSLAPHYYCPHCHYTTFKMTAEERVKHPFNEYEELLQCNLDDVESGFDLPNATCPVCGGKLSKDGHDIPFETFLGFKGDKVPDIDLNFSGDYQWRAHNFCKEVFGADHAFRAGTIATVAEKTACGYVRKYNENKNKEERTAEVIRKAKILEGTKRTTGQHPGGIIVIPSNYDVFDFTPIQYPANDTESSWFTTHFDYHGVLDETLLKLDILGHDDPTILKKMMDYVHEHPEEFPFDNVKDIPLDDPKVYQLLYPNRKGIIKNIAIPEFGTKFVGEMLKDTEPKNFAQLVKISGLSHGTDVWLNNAKDLVNGVTDFGHIKFKNVIGCRDDIMVQLIYFGCEAEKAFEIMEFVRKGKPTKEQAKWEEHKKYLKEHKVPDWYIWSCEQIKYMFPKAHATAYVLSAMRIAWFKVYKPLLFYSTYFSVRAIGAIDLETILKGKIAIISKIDEIKQKGFDATALENNQKDVFEVVLECLNSGIDIIAPDINRSLANDFIPLENQHSLIASLTSISGLGEEVAIKIIEERNNNPISSLEDLKERKIVNKTVLTNISALNCNF